MQKRTKRGAKWAERRPLRAKNRIYIDFYLGHHDLRYCNERKQTGSVGEIQGIFFISMEQNMWKTKGF